MTIAIPLGKLELSALNVRQTVDDGGTADLEASILAHGMLSPLVVHHLEKPRGRFGVLAGGRRLRALQAMAARGEIARDYKVDCVVRDETAATSTELSVIENTARVALTPAEEFQAFATLAEDPAMDTAAIARRFAVTELHVRQRMRLGQLHPDILAALGAGKMTLDAAKAYAGTADQALQMRVFGEQEKGWSGHHTYAIRNAIKRAGSAYDTDQMLKLVEVDAYLAAGGQLEEDLFAGGVRVLQPGTLAELYYARLEAEKAKLAAQLPEQVEVATSSEGLDWRNRVEAGPVLDDAQQARRRAIDERVDEIAARLEEIAGPGDDADDLECIVADVAENQPAVEQLLDEMRALGQESEAILEAAPVGLPDGPLIARAEAVDGALKVTGYYRPADYVDPELAQAARPGAANPKPSVKEQHGLSADAIDVMRSHRRAILRAAMVSQDTMGGVETAGDFLTFALLRATVPAHGKPGHVYSSDLGVPSDAFAPAHAASDRLPEVRDTQAFKVYARVIVELAEADWMTEPDLGQAFALFCELADSDRAGARAIAAAQMLDRTLNAPGFQVPLHDQLAFALGVDDDREVRTDWTPDRAFFERLPKKRRLAAVAEVSPRIAQKFGKLGDADLTCACVRFFAAEPDAVREYDMLPGQVMHARRWVPRFLSFNADPPGPTLMERHDSEEAATVPRAELDKRTVDADRELAA